MFDLPMIGSFKRGGVLDSHDPLDELWSQVERVGTLERMAAMTATKPGIDWAHHRQYAGVRIAQSVELRRSAMSAGLLTAPLPLYYSFLNMLRAFMSLVPEVLPSPLHGLRYQGAATLMDSAATFSTGTFTEYLTTRKVSSSVGSQLTLGECLALIVELARADRSQAFGQAMVVPVQVEAMSSGKVALHFDRAFVEESAFRKDWAAEFPSLAPHCVLAPSGTDLVLVTPLQAGDYEAICSFCEAHLVPGLLSIEDASWFALRQSGATPILPRDAYYFVAMFILSSVVRYEPELLDNAVRERSDVAWLLRRFLSYSERYYPQMMLSWANGSTFYTKSG